MSGSGSTLAQPGQFLNAFGYPRSDSANFANAVSATPPSPTFPGQLWWNTNDGQLYVYYVDANSAQWVAIQAAAPGNAPFQTGPGLSLNVGTNPPTIDVATPYLPLTGGALSGPITSGVAIRGGLIVGATGNIPAAGNITLNQNAVTPLATYAGSGFRVIGADGQVAGLVAETYGAAPPVMAGRNAVNTGASPAPVTAASILLRLQGIGYAGSAVYTGASAIDFYANETWTTSNSGSGLRLWSTPNGANASVTSLQLQGNAARLSGGLVVGAGNAPATPDPGPGALTLNANTVAGPASSGQLNIVGADTQPVDIIVSGYGAGLPGLLFRATSGTAATPTPLAAGYMSVVASYGYAPSGFAGGTQIISYNAEAGPYTNTAQGSGIHFNTIPIGSTAFVQSLLLQGNNATFSGTISAAGNFNLTGDAYCRNVYPSGNNTGNLGVAGQAWAIAAIYSVAALSGIYVGPGGAVGTTAQVGGDANGLYLKMPSGNIGVFFQNNAGSVNTLSCDGGGNLTIVGANAQKASGTTWSNPSAREIKQDIQPYAQGLQAVLALNPVTYRFNDSSGYDVDDTHIGLVHDETGHMPEMHRTAIIGPPDEPREVDALDCSAVTFALINAVKELKAELDALKAQLAGRA